MRWKRRGLNVRDRGWLGMGQKGVDTTILEQLLSVTNIAGEGLWAKGDRRCCVAGLVHGIGGSRPRALSNASPPPFLLGGFRERGLPSPGPEKATTKSGAEGAKCWLASQWPWNWRVCVGAKTLFAGVGLHTRARTSSCRYASVPPPPKDSTARAKNARGQYYL